jgi:hypothetical protein
MINETNPGWLEGLDPDSLGIGLFLVPDVSSDQFGAAQKLMVPDITYPQCVQRGMFTIAFKWVPHSVGTTSADLETRCGQPCVRTCVERGCICNPITGVCV